MNLVLDTNIYCDFAEGIKETVDIISEAGENTFLPAVVIGELQYGFMKGRRREWNEKKLSEVIKKLEISVVDVTRAVASKYGRIYCSLVRKGKKFPINCLDSRLLHGDRRHAADEGSAF